MPEMKTLDGYEVVDAKAREDIEGLQKDVAAIPEYVDDAIAKAPCKYEIINIVGASSTNTPVQAGSDILDRLTAGSTFPFYLYTKDVAGRACYLMPDYFTPISSSTILMGRTAYTNVQNNVALYSITYTFSKVDSIWNVRVTHTEVE